MFSHMYTWVKTGFWPMSAPFHLREFCIHRSCFMLCLQTFFSFPRFKGSHQAQTFRRHATQPTACYSSSLSSVPKGMFSESFLKLYQRFHKYFLANGFYVVHDSWYLVQMVVSIFFICFAVPLIAHFRRTLYKTCIWRTCPSRELFSIMAFDLILESALQNKLQIMHHQEIFNIQLHYINFNTVFLIHKWIRRDFFHESV